MYYDCVPRYGMFSHIYIVNIYNHVYTQCLSYAFYKADCSNVRKLLFFYTERQHYWPKVGVALLSSSLSQPGQIQCIQYTLCGRQGCLLQRIHGTCMQPIVNHSYTVSPAFDVCHMVLRNLCKEDSLAQARHSMPTFFSYTRIGQAKIMPSQWFSRNDTCIHMHIYI